MFSNDNDADDAVHRRRRRKHLVLLCLMWFYNRKKARRKSFRQLLNLEGRLRRDRSLRRTALCNPTESAWQKLYDSGDDPALIAITGMDHEAFN